MTSKGKGLAAGFKLPTKPPAPVKATVAAEAFLAAGERRPSSLRRTSRGERIAIYLPPETAEALRVRCAKDRRSISDATTVAVQAWLGL